MNDTLIHWRLTGLALLAGAFLAGARAADFQLASPLDPSLGAPAGGGGDSAAPVLSADGRYVLFASTAYNLCLISNNTVIPARIPAPLNVFLRDRSNGTNALISVNLSGIAGGNADSLPVDISSNGRWVLFESSASDLVAGDTNWTSDVFVRDLVNGTTLLVSANTNGVPANGRSRSAAITPDGRYVAFVSAATDLVAGDTNGIPDVFVRDLQANTTTLVSVGAVAGQNVYPYSSEAPDITPDGRYVVFQSTASGFVPGLPYGADIYVRDLVNGTTTWASTYARTLISSTNAVCFNHAISNDGDFIAYEVALSASGSSGPFFPGSRGVVVRYHVSTGVTFVVHTNAATSSLPIEAIHSLDMTPDGRYIAFIANTNGTATTCVLLWYAFSGISLVSGDINNAIPSGSTCDWPSVDPTGRFVAFLSSANNLTSNPLVSGYHTYLRDTLTATTTLLDADLSGMGSPVSVATMPRLSADASVAAFECADSILAPNDDNHAYDVFVRNLTSGTTELISAHDPALPSATANGPSTLSSSSLSSDGRFIAFCSESDDLVPNDGNGVRDVFVRDLSGGTTTLVSADTNGVCGDGASTDSSISGDGRYVAFTSLAASLAPGDNNKYQDVFVRDLQSGTTLLVSMNTNGTASGNAASYSPVISRDGRFVVFRSKATSLARGTYAAGAENLFACDLQNSVTYALTTNGVIAAAITPDGHYVAFSDTSAASLGRIFLWDTQAARRSRTNSTVTAIKAIAISPDGNRLAYWAGSASLSLFVADLKANTNWMILPNAASSPPPAMRFNASSQFLAFAAGTTNQIYLYSFLTSSNLLVSRSVMTSGPANAASDSPDVSADGRFVCYRSAATDITPAATNGSPQILLYDTASGVNKLLSASLVSGFNANNRSLTPVFSADGMTLVFQSWASDLIPQDFNHGSDLFAYTLFYAIILPSGSPAQGPWLSWPLISGRNYRVQYKNDLDENSWHDLGGTITNAGNHAWFQDGNPAAVRRFYRIVAF